MHLIKVIPHIYGEVMKKMVKSISYLNIFLDTTIYKMTLKIDLLQIITNHLKIIDICIKTQLLTIIIHIYQIQNTCKDKKQHYIYCAIFYLFKNQIFSFSFISAPFSHSIDNPDIFTLFVLVSLPTSIILLQFLCLSHQSPN